METNTEKKYNKLMQQYINAIDGFISISIALEEAETKIIELQEKLNKLEEIQNEYKT